MEKSSFFNAVIDQNGTPDRSYLAEDFAKYFSTFIGNGVFPNPANQLQVAAVDDNMQIRIKAGFAWINGYMYENTDDYIFKLYPADGVLNRIDRIVLRLDFLERRIKAVVKQGDYASNSVAKNLQRDADAYEIALADVFVGNGVIKINQSNITDLRLNSDVCGIVYGTIKQVDTTEIFRQYQAWFLENKSKHEKDFEVWMNEFKIVTGKKFIDWVDDLKNSLDPNEDIAAQLQMQISTVKSDLADMATKEDLGNINDTTLPVELKGKSLTEQTKSLFQFASSGKQCWVDVIGSPLNSMDTFSTLKSKTQTLKNTFASNLTDKGQNSSGTENLSSLINKVSKINTGIWCYPSCIINQSPFQKDEINNICVANNCQILKLTTRDNETKYYKYDENSKKFICFNASFYYYGNNNSEEYYHYSAKLNKIFYFYNIGSWTKKMYMKVFENDTLVKEIEIQLQHETNPIISSYDDGDYLYIIDCEGYYYKIDMVTMSILHEIRNYNVFCEPQKVKIYYDNFIFTLGDLGSSDKNRLRFYDFKLNLLKEIILENYEMDNITQHFEGIVTKEDVYYIVKNRLFKFLRLDVLR